jgi:30S ribosomal protein S31
MGKGDKKSKKGKMVMGSFGNSRPRKIKAATIAKNKYEAAEAEKK